MAKPTFRLQIEKSAGEGASTLVGATRSRGALVESIQVEGRFILRQNEC